jgi:hypothetical protein
MRLLRPVLAALVAVCALVVAAIPASARLMIEIDKSAQRMTVSLDGEPIHRWPVSTGLRAYDTPSGEFTPFRLEEDHYSREWDDAPMPHSIFFTKKGHAIHGTTHLRNIGRPASHGCVRLEPENARVLFGLVQRHGLPNTRVVLLGETPANAPAVARRAPEYGGQPGYVDPRDGGGELYSSPRRAPPALRDGEDLPTSAPRRVEREYPPRDVRPDYRQGYRDQGYRGQGYWGQGYWLRRPDGSLVFVDRERDYRQPPPPPPPYFFGNRRWD